MRNAFIDKSSAKHIIYTDTVSKYFTGGNFYEESYIIHNSSHNLVSVDFRDIFAEETFNGTAEGHNGSVSVAVKIGDGGVLKQAEVTSHIETKGISDRAITEIPKRILEAQSLQVDVMSGATFTSRAVINAVRNTIKATGLDANSYVSNPTPKGGLSVKFGIWPSVWT